MKKKGRKGREKGKEKEKSGKEEFNLKMQA